MPEPLQADLGRLHTQLRLAQTAVVAFAAPLDHIHHDMALVLGAAGLALVAWAWQRRAILEPERETSIAGLPEAWRAAARVVMQAWETAGRASSVVENWHSILRPHLAVDRTLSPGLLALLAVWHTHRVFRRGVHTGSSPLQLRGMGDAPTDWLVELGYPPVSGHTRPTGVHINDLALAA